jgi:hypothetical protein
MRSMLGAIALAMLLAGCQSAPEKPPARAPVAVDPEIEEAAEDVEASKADYEGCLRDQEDDRYLNCEAAKEMYEEDQQAYDAILIRKKAKAGR